MEHPPRGTVLIPIGEIDTNQTVQFVCDSGQTNLLTVVVPTMFAGKPSVLWRFSFDPRTDEMVSMRPELYNSKAQQSPPK
jgi:hypothetical protein